MQRLVFLSFYFLLGISQADAARLAFFRGGTSDDPLTHVALEVDAGWIHADPQRGVVLDPHERFAPLLKGAVLIENSRIPAPGPLVYSPWLGRLYDRTFDWHHPDRTHCTRLVADLLGGAISINLEPMRFSSHFWKRWVEPDTQRTQRGLPGLSPGRLYSQLLAQGWSLVHGSVPPCSLQLKGL